MRKIKDHILYMLITLLCLGSYTVTAQDDTDYENSIRVEGTVLYSNLEPVNDVSISIENEKISPVFTDSAGRFAIQAPGNDSWLLVSPVHSFKPKRIYIGKQRDFVIYLTPNESESIYDEVRSNMGIMEKRNLLSSAGYWEKGNFTNFGYASIEQYMSGAIPGFYNINQTGLPGSGSFSSIRGVNSIYSTNQPLYIIDEVIMERPGIYSNLISGYNYNPIASIKPEDVSSITVLKDGSATSQYGLKGANGVIIIETLKTTETKTNIDLTMHSGISFLSKRVPVLNAEQYRTYAHELLQSSNFPEENIQQYYPGLIINETSKNIFNYIHNTNWQEALYRQGNTYNAYLSILGGDAVAKYGISFSYDQFNGIMDNTDFGRLGIRLVGNINVLPRLKLYMNAYLNNTNENQVEDMTEEQVSPQYVAMAKPPILGPYVYDNTGQPTNQLIDPLEFNISNPLAVSEGYIGEINNTRIMGSFKAIGELTDRLNLKALLSINKNNLTEKVYFPNIGVTPYENGEINNISKRSHNSLTSFYNNTYIEFTGDNSGAHDLYMTGGFRVNSSVLQTDLRIAKNLPENDAVNNLGEGEDNKRVIDGDSPSWRWVSYYLSGRYSYKDKYLLDAVLSMDASSTIGMEAEDMIYLGEQPYALFYSIGSGWRLSNEEFLRGVSVLDELKIRASYSVAGNDDIGVYSALDYYTQLLYRGVTGIVPGRTKNMTLKNETMSLINIGTDLMLYGEKFVGSVNVFQNKTKDLFLQTRAEGWIWDELIARNSGSSVTNGIEFNIGTHLKLTKKLVINSSFQMSVLQSKINEIYKEKVVIPIDGGELLYQSGLGFPQFYGYQFEGVYSTLEEAEQAGLVNDENLPFVAGDAIFADISGPDGEPDGKISDYDKTTLGSPFPRFYGGWWNNISLGRWKVDINLQFVSGNKIYNYKRYLSERMSDFSNQSLHVEQRWRQEGDHTDTPRALLGDQIGNSNFSSRWIEDGSYIRLKSVALRYVIPDKFITFQNAEFYITGTNLFTVTNYLGDPEAGRGYRNYQQGVDYGLLPNVRTIILGVKVGL